MDFQAINSFVTQQPLDGRDTLRITKDPKIIPFDEPTFARIAGPDFRDGVIEVNVLSRLLPDAPDFARGFIGVTFRISPDNTSFEGLYIRPTNGRVDDALRRQRAVQYFSYPDYKFDTLREKFPGQFETGADIGLNEWIAMRIEVEGPRARLFLNGNPQPVIAVPQLFHGAGTAGGIGLWVDIGTEGYFADLKVR